MIYIKEEQNMNKKTKIDWIIHHVTDDTFIDGACNAHTHLTNYDHQDFQVVLNLPSRELGRILNTFGLWVQSGQKFYAGQYVENIYDDCPVRLDEFEETGRKVLRVVIPDMNNKFPEDPECAYPYNIQKLTENELGSL
jgi:hypothetical protein